MQLSDRGPWVGSRRGFPPIAVGVCAIAALLAGCPPAPQSASSKQGSPTSAAEETTTQDSMFKLRDSTEGLGAAIAAHNQPVASYHLKTLEQALHSLREEHSAVGDLAQEKLGASVMALRVALEDADWPQVTQKHEALVASCTSCHAPPWKDGTAPVGSAADLGFARSRLRLGVLAAEGEDATRLRWEPLAEHLSASLRVEFELVPLGFDEVAAALTQGRVEFLLTNPASFVRLREPHGLRLLTTLLSRREGKGYALFGGLLVMRTGEAHGLSGLKGLRLAAVDPDSLGGWRLQRAELLAAGIDPERDLELSFCTTHEAVLRAVQNRQTDVGAVPTGALSDLIAEGELPPGALQALAGARNLYAEGLNGRDFPFPLSTRLVPHWPLCASPQVPEELSIEVAKALLSLGPRDPACRAAKIQGFGLPRDYSLVQQLVAEQDGLQRAPAGWRSAARVLRPALVLDVVLLIALGLALLGLLRRGTALRAERDAAMAELEHDPLTGLLTARSLGREFKQIQGSGQPGSEVALLHVDLDRFRQTCTTLGSEVAEAVLRHVAGRLAATTPESSVDLNPTKDPQHERTQGEDLYCPLGQTPRSRHQCSRGSRPSLLNLQRLGKGAQDLQLKVGDPHFPQPGGVDPVPFHVQIKRFDCGEELGGRRIAVNRLLRESSRDHLANSRREPGVKRGGRRSDLLEQELLGAAPEGPPANQELVGDHPHLVEVRALVGG